MSNLVSAYNGADLGYDIPPTKVAMPSRAELGSPSIGGISPEDPAASLTLIGHRPFWIDELDCSQPRLFTGWIAERNMGRSFDQAQLAGPNARIHDTTITDLNEALRFRIITWTDGNRPEESVDDRLAWLLASNYVAGPDGTLFEDTGFVHTGFSLLMDACDYRGSYPADVLEDMSTRYATVINYFVFWDPDAAAASLFWNYVGAATMDCTLSISNDLGDLNSTCFAPITESRLERTPEEVYSDVIVNYANGSCYRILDATATAFIKRGTSISRPHIGKLSTAQAAGDAYLASHNVETDRITTTIHLPASQVGLIQAGMRMDVKFTHLTDYTAFTSMRIVACNPRPVDDLARFYDVDLELVSPQVAFVCPSPTPDGYYPPTGVPGGSGCGGASSAQSDATGNVVYLQAGLAFPVVPTPNYCGYWHFPQWHLTSGTNSTTPAGFADGASVNVDNAVRCLVSGPGRMTIYTRAETLSGGGAVWMDALLQHTPDGGATVVTDASQTHITPGDDIIFDIPYGGFCDHWVHVSFLGDNPIFGIGFGGFDWVSGTYSTGGIVPTVSQTQATTDPTVTDDLAAGYLVGSTWINTTSGDAFVLVDNTTGAAVWQSTTVASGTAGGDLSGTYPDPTVVGIQGTPVDALPVVATEYLDGTGHWSTPPGTATALTVEDESAPLATAADTLNFVGAGVVASGAGTTKTITIPGTSGGGFTTPTVIQRYRGVNSPFTLTGAPIAGHRLVVGIVTLGGTTTGVSSANTTWTQVGTDQAQNSNKTSIWVGVCAASPGATITVTHTGTSIALVLEVADALTPTVGATAVDKETAANYSLSTAPINVAAGHFVAASVMTDAANNGVGAMLSVPFTGWGTAVQYSAFVIGYAPTGDVLTIGLGTAGSSCVAYMVEIT